jgi:hypothetical protein
VSYPLCTSFTITVVYGDSQGSVGTASSSGTIAGPPPANPPPARGRYKCSGTSCVFDANDSGPNQCTPGANACGVPPPPQPPQPPPPTSQVTMTWSMNNTCGTTQHFRFHDETNNLVWPSSSTHYSLNSQRTQTYNLSCRPGANICPGGGSSTDGSGPQWGIGLRGDRRCTDCCFTCRSVTIPGRIECFTTLAEAATPMTTTKSR